mmetsp:Transcript_70837/g.135042  ORF Transcript_70837/g.135042 Transcript_70837/m.135042 type:complete len:227 (-) Transcript_70837:338-1018(-)
MGKTSEHTHMSTNGCDDGERSVLVEMAIATSRSLEAYSDQWPRNCRLSSALQHMQVSTCSATTCGPTPQALGMLSTQKQDEMTENHIADSPVLRECSMPKQALREVRKVYKVVVAARASAGIGQLLSSRAFDLHSTSVPGLAALCNGLCKEEFKTSHCTATNCYLDFADLKREPPLALKQEAQQLDIISDENGIQHPLGRVHVGKRVLRVLGVELFISSSACTIPR